MSNKKEKLKSSFHNLKTTILKKEIWEEVKDYIRDDLNSGEIVDILKVDKRKFYTCKPGYPEEYCSDENLEKDFYVITSTGATLIIKECAFGLEFEAPCDRTEFYVFNEKKEVLYPPKPEKARQLIADYYKK